MADRRYRLEPPLLFADTPFEVSLEGGTAAGAGSGAGGPGGASSGAGSGAGGSGGGAGGGEGGGEGGGGGGEGGGSDSGSDNDGGSNPAGAVTFVHAQQQIAPVFATQPSDLNLIANDNGSFTSAASGFPAYQWQSSPDGIAPYTNLANGRIFSGVTTGTLRLSNVPIEYSGHHFQLVATNAGGTATSNPATLTVSAPANKPYIVDDPVDTSAAAGGSASFAITAGGSVPLVYQWQVSEDNGATWTNVPNGGVYSGSTTNTLTINPVN